VFVAMDLLQREIEQNETANVVLVSGDDLATLPGDVDRALAQVARPEDLGVIVRPLHDTHALSVEGSGGFINRDTQSIVQRAAARVGPPIPILTYIANTIRVRDRSVPYSVVSAVDIVALGAQPHGTRGQPGTGALAPLWLNEWATRELHAVPGDTVALDYFLWSDAAGLTTARSEFSFAGSVPMSGVGGDRTLTPDYPGMTTAAHMGDWDPPFPIDLRRIEPRDERY
jgi:hypothetical protein